MRVPYTLTNNSVTVFVQGKIKTVRDTGPSWSELVEHLKGSEHDEQTILDLVDRENYVRTRVSNDQDVMVANGAVYYKGKPLHNTLTDKLLDLLDDGHDISPWVAFLQNLMQNPSYRSREALYDFLEHFSAPITPDGHFIAFKRVRGDYMDIHSGTFRNAPGDVVKMDRADVDDDNSRTCSAGLHVAASEYLQGYYNCHNSRTMVVKVNPRDVVSVPYDYNFSKMRTCQYTVLSEIEPEKMEDVYVDSLYDLDIEDLDGIYDDTFDDDWGI